MLRRLLALLMAIAWGSAGAGVSTETSGAALSPLCPATVNAGDILLLQVAWEGTTTAPSPPGDWTILGGSPYNVGSAAVVARHWLYGKIADGTEDGAAVALGSPAVTTQRAARIHRFTGRVSGTITDCIPAASFSSLVGDTDPTGPTVNTTVAGSLAVAAVYQNDNNTLETFAGASDTWTERGTAGGYIFALNPGGVLDLLTATPDPDPSTVSGGAMTVTNDPWSVIGFEIRPSLPVVTGTGALTSGAASVDGAGTSSSTGAGTLTAQVASVDGAGTSSSTGTGALASQAAAVDGAGTSSSTGAGALAAGSATVVGEGEVSGEATITGSGDLVAGGATISGVGTTSSIGAGILLAQAAAVDGAGISMSSGFGALLAAAASAAGAGVSSSVGSGALESGPASVSGTDEVPPVGGDDAGGIRPFLASVGRMMNT